MNSTLSPLPPTQVSSAEHPSGGPAIWNRYRKNEDPLAEEELVLHYLPLVKTVVGRLAMTLPAHVSLEDLNSVGLMGLLQALRSYRPGGVASFETFARFRIRGAVLDELRRMDWVPRSVHDQARKVQKARSGLEQKLGRPPTEVEMAQALGLSIEEYLELIDEVRPAAFVHLDSLLHPHTEDQTTLHECLPDDQQEIPLETTSKRELIQLVKERLEQLPKIQKQVLSLYYVEDLRIKEIAVICGLTESRISQIHTQAILAIRGFMARYEASPALL
jgi:RNA polymerase sigma factor for flagellar operon FliA